MRTSEVIVIVLLALVTLMVIAAFIVRTDGFAFATLLVALVLGLLILPLSWTVMPFDEQKP